MRKGKKKKVDEQSMNTKIKTTTKANSRTLDTVK